MHLSSAPCNETQGERGFSAHGKPAMKHLVKSFQENRGVRGCHFYSEDNVNFLLWLEVFQFVNSLPAKSGADPFADKLMDSLANFDPDCEFLAVCQNGDTVSVELYSQVS